MNQKLVSIIITNYNYEKFITEAIESVLKQTYQHFQLIIVDDGSTDNSKKIINQYATLYPAKIKVIFKENGGQGSAFNEGYMATSNSDIVTFLDADDYIFPTRLERIVELHEQYDIVEHSLVLTNNSCFVKPDKINLCKDFKESGKYVSFAPTSAISYNRKLLDKFFPIPDDITKICADSYVNIGALYYGEKVVNVKECLGYYRIHDNNNWYSNQSQYLSLFDVFLERFNMILKSKRLPHIPGFEDNVKRKIAEIEQKKPLKRIAIYGIGNYSKIVTNALANKSWDIKCYIVTENNAASNKYFYGKEIIEVDKILNWQDEIDLIIIASSFTDEIVKELSNFDIGKEIIILE